ncbi:uncharacterized protein CPUR_07692 [Claviceps purpurea 20.1]|uniref:Uncharacterized protein n=1 Tax=Claviceps purpurea (strain 20.1) TaxID=1111077 RepID=M1W4V8_CLAP2|nr:uncharacterized protein CPUR_07692 [Claviceps purpurea 20.1]
MSIQHMSHEAWGVVNSDKPDSDGAAEPNLTYTRYFTVTNKFPDHSEIPRQVLHHTLMDKASAHMLSKDDACQEQSSNCFVSEERYSDEVFRGILPDTAAAGISTASTGQAKALMRIMLDLRIEEGDQPTVDFGAFRHNLRKFCAYPRLSE